MRGQGALLRILWVWISSMGPRSYLDAVACSHDASCVARGVGVTVANVVIFDANETLSDMSPMGRRFLELGAAELMAMV